MNTTTNAGNVLLYKRDFVGAIKEYSTAISLVLQSQSSTEPKVVTSEEAAKLGKLYSNRSLAYSHLCDYQSAYEDSLLVVEYQSNWPKAYYRKGQALQYLKRFKEARESFELQGKLLRSMMGGDDKEAVLAIDCLNKEILSNENSLRSFLSPLNSVEIYRSINTLDHSQKKMLFENLLLSDKSLINIHLSQQKEQANENGLVFHIEILRLIFEYLDCYDSILNSQLTCKLWRNEINALPRLWRELFMKEWSLTLKKEDEFFLLGDRNWKSTYLYGRKEYISKFAPQTVLEMIEKEVNTHTQRFLYSILSNTIQPVIEENYFVSNAPGATPIWFQWENDKWYWTPDKIVWMCCPILTVSGIYR
jgi:tetratricopeptide (TPR) repeat protein